MAVTTPPKARTAIALAATGLAISAYLAAYQCGVISDVWDPLFDGQSRRVLTSAISRWLLQHLGVPDAAWGAGAYGLEMLLLAGSRRASQYRSLVQACAKALAVGLVLVSSGLVALQAFVVHAWCTLCLASAVVSCSVFLLSL
jgi:hypothetical protein